LDTIVIRTDSSERGSSIASCLRILFPLCEIVVQSGNSDGHEDVQKASNPKNSGKRVLQSS